MHEIKSLVRALPWLACACCTSLAAAQADDLSPAARREFFEARIRPVLVERCYECHNTTETAEGDLALDDRAGLLKGGASGPAIVPGQPAQSRLMKVLRHEIEGQEMPEGGPQLDDRTIADFETWIAAGAVDPRDAPPTADELEASTGWPAVFERRKAWWSLQPIRRPAVPAVEHSGWSAHPVDRFVLAQLEAAGLEPNPPADAATLVRRLYFVLIGLPPTPDEADTWTRRLSQTADAARDATVAELVDHLLASPHFGERWARHWMDWIRYAESHGSEGDPPVAGAWMYRDYLIRALNADVPYDQLVREHVAGDLLESPRVNTKLGINESLIGTAHWRMVFHGFAPTDALDERVRFTDDQINVFSKAFLGLTVSCARCHDHKFDAISQRDYYALYGILNSCRPGRAVVDLPEIAARHSEQLAALKPRVRAALADDWLAAVPRLKSRLLADDEAGTKADQPQLVLHAWHAMRRAVAMGQEFPSQWRRLVDGWQHERQAQAAFHNRADVRRWKLADTDEYANWYRHGQGLADRPLPAGEFAIEPEGDAALVGIYPAGAYSHRLSTRHAARLTSRNVQLDDDYELYVRAIGDGGATLRYVVRDYPRNGTVYPVTDLPGQWKWQRYDLSYWNGDEIHIELAAALDAPLLVKDKPRSWFGVREAVLVKKGNPGPGGDEREFLDPLFAACQSLPGGAPADLDQLADGYVRALSTAIEAWRDRRASNAQALLLDACLAQGLLANKLDELPTARPLLAEYRALEADVPVVDRVPGLAEAEPRDQPLFTRGNHKAPAEEVPRRFLEAIDSTPYQSKDSGRLRLAEDVLRGDNPLARRVIVNRVWHHMFAAGLVPTPDNFGRLGALPSHPELLDYLAARFAPLASDAQASSAGDDFGWSLKQLIRFLVTSKTWQFAAQPSALARQVDPDNRFLSHAHVRRLEAEAIRDALLSASGRMKLDMYGEPVTGEAPRRSVYVRVVRNQLDPLLRVFDFPEPFSATGRRDTTNVPAQSLTMMNDRLVESCAAAWAERLLADASLASDEQRIERMFLAAFGRPATSDETERATAYLSNLRGQLAALARRSGELRVGIEQHQDARRQLLEPARERLLAEAKDRQHAETLPKPIARWEFDDDLRDAVGQAHAAAHGEARLEDGALRVDGRAAYAVTAPLPYSLKSKTLEAWVMLDTLEQCGGGVMSVQTPDGVVFDAIVFGEKNPHEWLAGSNVFARTQSFAGPTESEATTRAVHVAIAYHTDGRIVGYRDGRPYGQAYQSNGPIEFAAGKTVVSFGLRHLPATGNRMLAGRILKAQLYDRALSDDEVLAASGAAGAYVPEAQVIASLTAAERETLDQHQAALEQLQAERDALGPLPASTTEQSSWKDLARAIFCFKEFIYIK